ncbi:MAG: hypothetical protein WCR70_02095 [Sphaerochaetaceae bacterium]|jgi:hypothetical protein
MLINDNESYQLFCSLLGQAPTFFDVYKTYFGSLPSPFNKSRMLEDLFIKLSSASVVKSVMDSITPVQSAILTYIRINGKVQLKAMLAQLSSLGQQEVAAELDSLLSKGLVIQASQLYVLSPVFKDEDLEKVMSLPRTVDLPERPQVRIISNMAMFLYAILALIINRKATANGAIRFKKADCDIFSCSKETLESLASDASHLFAVSGVIDAKTDNLKINPNMARDFFSAETYRIGCAFLELKQFGLQYYEKHLFRSVYQMIFSHQTKVPLLKAVQRCFMGGVPVQTISTIIQGLYQYGLIDWSDEAISVKLDTPKAPSLDTDLKANYFSRPPLGSLLPLFCEPVKSDEATVLAFSKQSVFAAFSAGLESSLIEGELESSFFRSQLEAYTREHSRACIYEGTVLVLDADVADFISQSPTIEPYIIKRLSQKVFFMKGSRKDMKAWSTQLNKLLGSKAEIPVITEPSADADTFLSSDWNDDSHIMPRSSSISLEPGYEDRTRELKDRLFKDAQEMGLLNAELQQAIEDGTVIQKAQFALYSRKPEPGWGDYSDAILTAQSAGLPIVYRDKVLKLQRCRKQSDAVCGYGYSVVDESMTYVSLSRFEKPRILHHLHV